ncbi:cellulose biosynthesis cyclic di-GMP-binding regulatory protein BcsB [Legionella anisa]|uniref:Cyclic di-GMP-binding protein n=1 Tax=Legionella anisa TaxID=28082 RepID=A0AAX0WUL6_9GAMM|nr:cellulose biosynthesis cyclic di-GMP-binding regulatory protein BcsB [Legionella anisa]AWN73764.1 cellulose biosynthesis cyclic di-GMP-binding regulatory protein BcsB [Legionella anisa]KTC70378.1 Cyclic di-GMP-binding protein precursor [Legionella anisa]MCW8426663.1 cellulose biosynthesis cyclic di-GMP-binding regulatory protein BcsB [Legionella anisa]MCW8448326.1 cellulose biosynthesis cyclic di-GMP-binding regulatory protein BcsB [Legionella anisa]PNL62327.1 cellulose biosynthesis cyclic 
MIRKIIWITLLVFGFHLHAAPVVTTNPDQIAKPILSVPANVPTRKVKLYFNNLNQQQGNFTLGNFTTGRNIEFTMRKDELIFQAALHLQFIPSPSLIPLLSQLKIYLNDQLVDVIAISAEQLGKLNSIDIPIDSRFINDFNRLRLEFIGHYKAICENPAHSSIWMDIDKNSYLELNFQTLLLKNDLSHFPAPFFDPLDKNRLNLPIIFSEQPNLAQQRAAAILASWFGSKALWRGSTFPVLYNQVPTSNAIIFATNAQRPNFLKNYKTVQAPTVEMISHPNNPYIKLLVISGRDDKDLVTAVQGIAQGNVLFRGPSVSIDNVKMLQPRKPYDAPNWIPTYKPVTFAKLKEFDEQLQTKGFTPFPISLRFNIPPDLFLHQSRGIDLFLKYRYSLPPAASISQLQISLNNSFVKSYMLEPKGENAFAGNMAVTSKQLYIPAKLGAHNQFTFDFAYGTQVAGGVQNEQCITYQVINNLGVIDDASTLDLSNYYHYIAMPNLNAFMSSGFPFSILADLSQTVVYIDPQSKPEAVTSLLNVSGNIGAATGYPVLAMTLTDNWSQVKNKDADILIIGTLPKDLRDNDDLNLLINKTQDWIKKPLNRNAMPDTQRLTPFSAAESKTTVTAMGSVAAIFGIQSPYYKKRSIVALLAESQQGFDLLNRALTNNKNVDKIFGSVAVIRDSGINSLRVGNKYYLGYLPLLDRLWESLQKHPISLALLSLLAAVIITFLMWNGLSALIRHRLKGTQKDKT